MIKSKWLFLILLFSETYTMEKKDCRAFCIKLFCCYPQQPVVPATLTKTDTTDQHNSSREDTPNNTLFNKIDPYRQYDIKSTMQLISGIADQANRLALSHRYCYGFPKEWAEQRKDSYEALVLSLHPSVPAEIIHSICNYTLKIDAAVNKQLIAVSRGSSIGTYDDALFIPPRGHHKDLPHHDNNDSTNSNTLFFNIIERPFDVDDDLFTSRGYLTNLPYKGSNHDLYSKSEESSNHQ